jgi:hypothetical protein
MMRASERYDSLIVFYAERYGRDPKQVKRQVRAESAFNPDARSPAGAIGLLQFVPRTWAEWSDGIAGIEPPPHDLRLIDPRDPEDAISAGCAYMAALERACLTFLPEEQAASRWTLAPALACFNWGYGHVRKLFQEHGMNGWRHRLPPETTAYLLKCLAFDDEVLTVTT